MSKTSGLNKENNVVWDQSNRPFERRNPLNFKHDQPGPEVGESGLKNVYLRTLSSDKKSGWNSFLEGQPNHSIKSPETISLKRGLFRGQLNSSKKSHGQDSSSSQPQNLNMTRMLKPRFTSPELESNDLKQARLKKGRSVSPLFRIFGSQMKKPKNHSKQRPRVANDPSRGKVSQDIQGQQLRVNNQHLLA